MSTSKVNLINSEVPTLLGIAYKFGDWLITLLQLYILINSALVSWILTTKPSWQIGPKVIITIVYSLAMCINFVWMFRLHRWLTKIIIEIEIVMGEVEFASFEQNIHPIISTVLKRGWWYMLFAFHLISDAVVIICIWFLTNNSS